MKRAFADCRRRRFGRPSHEGRELKLTAAAKKAAAAVAPHTRGVN